MFQSSANYLVEVLVHASETLKHAQICAKLSNSFEIRASSFYCSCILVTANFSTHPAVNS